MSNSTNGNKSYTLVCADLGWPNERKPCGWSGTVSENQLETHRLYSPGSDYAPDRKGIICPKCGNFIPIDPEPIYNGNFSMILTGWSSRIS